MISLKLILSFICIIYYTCFGQMHRPDPRSDQFENIHKKFEYKYSFKGPYLAQKDGTVPFWTYEGSAIASEEMVRITPSLKSKKGSIWTKNPTNFDWFEVEIWFRVNGRARLGADGLAFWYTDRKYEEGPVFGSADNWRGLGVFFDSFDNDNKGNNPYIMAMINDGTKNYDHQTDGHNQQLNTGCLRDFRNKPFPVRARIQYFNNILSIRIHSGNNNNDDEFETCLHVENIYLSQNGYLGISAATGGLADDHDVIKFLAYRLSVPDTQPSVAQPVVDPEKEKFVREYELYKERLEKKKEDYFKQHPDEAKKLREHEELSPDHEYENVNEKELQQIFSGQSQIFESIKILQRKLEEVLLRQERTLSMVGNIHPGSMTGPPVPPPGVGGGVPPMPMQRHEFESLLNTQQELVRNSRDVKSILSQQTQFQVQPASVQQGQGHNLLNQQLLTEIRDSINVLRKELGTIGTRVMGSTSPSIQCPSVNCLSLLNFIIISLIHLGALLGFIIYKGNKDNHAKKFY